MKPTEFLYPIDIKLFSAYAVNVHETKVNFLDRKVLQIERGETFPLRIIPLDLREKPRSP